MIALVRNNKLYVANVGDSRALLCRTDENGVLRVIQLSSDHDLSNEDELLRLYNLGLDKISQGKFTERVQYIILLQCVKNVITGYCCFVNI